MIAFVLALHLWTQGIPLAAAQTGTVSGVVRSADGAAAIGVRVAAMLRPDSLDEAAASAAFVSLAATDAEGRYTLESIPPGLYYIVVGRTDFPTYFPGTQDMARATAIPMTPGATVNGVNFVVGDDTLLDVSALLNRPGWTIPFRVSVDNGKLPIFAQRGFLELKLTRRVDGVENLSMLINSQITVQPPSYAAPVDYVVTVENLPDGYAIRSMTFGADELIRGVLRLSPKNFPPAPIILRSGSTSTVPAGTSTIPLTITLTDSAGQPASGGVRVSGSAEGARSVYMTGASGFVYSDGTFEFRGVPPGVSVLSTPHNPNQPRGAVIVIGDRDMSNVQLEPVSMLPAEIRIPASATSRASGRLPLPSLKARVIELKTKQPIAEGLVILRGSGRAEFPLADGRFEIPRLLPGSYTIEVQVFGHANVREDIVVGDADVMLELSAERLY